ncbi:MAG: preprotein translocase subunit SecA [Parafannyhessea sp.]|uniref:preprotein translocase subunit SecA n=1 Tax=Parafannyhessea sp. TaxID=2847324 RepID=UPI003EFE0FC0
MANIFARLLSRGADKQLKEFEAIAEQVNDFEPQIKALSDEELRGQTVKFRERYDNGESLDDLLPEAFATVREASVRSLGMRHFDVQVIGGIALHRGMIAEMKTGEGKTLVSTLAGYLNAIPGKGVHIVTVNDYLAKRDSEWMGQVYKFLGMSVGILQNGMKLSLKKPAYDADVTYGTNSEFGFDYLRDNMVGRADMRVQRGHNFAIVDEVDSILIDEARTPLIISGAGTKSASTYKDFARAVRGLTPDVDFEMDEAKHTIAATDEGLRKIESRLGIDNIYSDMSGQLVNHLQQALKAQYMFHRDQQYVVVDGEVKIVDEFTGRIMEGRRYSEGLHQAIEAKENVYVREENQTLATITLQNYFRLYDKLSGMTGTAMTEDAEFREIYNLPVQVIPPNKPVIRVDHDDLVYRTIDAKFNAVADDVEKRHATGQPVLVGTVSIESSERLSRILDKRGIKHEVLNAKFHEREAQIVAQAGREGAVTIATNMAGRGTDILLGGNPDVLAVERMKADGIDVDEGVDPAVRERYVEAAKKTCEKEKEHVLAAGGLCVIGTERHESRRIDNQLRGRAGRQGDPGETQFYLSLEDDLMRLFGGDRMDKISALMSKYDMPDDMPIQAKIVTKAVEGAQRKVEEINFAMRKNVLDYDDVMNKQRQVIYEERNKILDGKDLVAHIEEVTHDTVERKVREFCGEDHGSEDWDLKGLRKWVEELTGRDDLPEFDEDPDIDTLTEQVDDFVIGCYHEKSKRLSDEIMQQLSAQVMLRVIDTRWMSYLQEMDYLKTGIGLRGFGQRDPLVEYKTEAYAAFTELVNTMYEDFLRTILRLELVAPLTEDDGPDDLRGASYSGPADVDGDHGGARSALAQGGQGSATHAAPKHAAPAKPSTYRKADDPDPYVGVGRNDPCPCGSGKKFKNCHGRNR